MSPGFSRHQLKKLATELDQKRVHSRQQDGKHLSYIEGWFAIAEANRIFGYDGWDRQMVQCERVFERRSGDVTICGYAARVRISVRASGTTIVREGSGFGQAAAAKTGDAHERALKAAETDATKRALATFGGRFGLMLYDKQRKVRESAPGAGSATSARHPGVSTLGGIAGRNGAGSAAVSIAGERQPEEPGVDPEGRNTAAKIIASSQVTSDIGAPTATTEHFTVPGSDSRRVGESDVGRSSISTSAPRPSFRLIASDGSATTLHSGESFCTALRQLVEAAQDREEVVHLTKNNAAVIVALRAHPDLKTPRGEHYTDVLEHVLAKRVNELRPASEPQAPESVAAPRSEPTSNASDAQKAEAPPVAAIERAVAEAVALDTADLAPIFRPFVPVPAYPLAQVAERVAAGAKRSKNRETDASVEAVASELPPMESEVLAAAQISEPDNQPRPTRRSQITGGFAIDKSALLIPSERRLRTKAHLNFVASKPCLVCEELPCHAHHITFAQPRGLSQKVSDEFTVPLCAVHHNELHAFGNEASWWRVQGIEPLRVANALWNETVNGRPDGKFDQNAGPSRD